MSYLTNTTWLLSEKVFRMGVSLLVGVWVARYLGPHDYGLFSYAQSFVGLFTVIATLGLDSIVVRELVKNTNRRYEFELLGTAFFLKLIGAFLVLLLLAIAINFTLNDKFTNILIFIIASSTIFQSFNVVDYYFQSKVLSKYIVFANAIAFAIISIAKVIFIVTEAQLIAFAVLIFLESVILSIGYIYYFSKKAPTFKICNFYFKVEIASYLLKNSWLLIFSGIAISIYIKIDQVMIKTLLDNESVGHYAAAIRLSESTYFIPMVICSSLFPALVNAKKINDALYYTRVQKLYDAMIWIAIFIAIPITLFSDSIIHILFGEDYFLTSNVLMIQIWSGIFNFFGIARGKWLIVENKQNLSFFYLFYGTLLNVTLNYIFIPKIGILGATYATLISLISMVMIFPLFNTTTRISVLMFFNAFNIKRLFDENKNFKLIKFRF